MKRRKDISVEEAALAAQAACVLEASAPKPGSVNRLHDFADTTFEDFMFSALAIGKAMRLAWTHTVGEVVLKAVEDTLRLVSTNTNLGMILLLTPLVKAAVSDDLRAGLRKVLRELSETDADLVYKAIRLTAPGGLGKVTRGDINDGAKGTLREMMYLAREHDAVAAAYVNDYQVVFEVGYPALINYYGEEGNKADAIVKTYLSLLEQQPDSLIMRKCGRKTAEEISCLAGLVLKAKMSLAEFDGFLRRPDNRLNPGTTSDLVAACIFVAILMDGLFLKTEEI